MTDSNLEGATAAGGARRDRASRKSAAAYRTISEVSEELDVPQHVLRFWETKFNQVRPLKRGGGRRYYRPEDIRLLGQIQKLLYSDGYTIKGVQRLLKEGLPLDDQPPAAQAAAHGAGDAAPAGRPETGPDTPDPQGSLLAVMEPAPPTSMPGLAPPVRAELETLLDELRAIRQALPV